MILPLQLAWLQAPIWRILSDSWKVFWRLVSASRRASRLGMPSKTWPPRQLPPEAPRGRRPVFLSSSRAKAAWAVPRRRGALPRRRRAATLVSRPDPGHHSPFSPLFHSSRRGGDRLSAGLCPPRCAAAAPGRRSSGLLRAAGAPAPRRRGPPWRSSRGRSRRGRGRRLMSARLRVRPHRVARPLPDSRRSLVRGDSGADAHSRWTATDSCACWTMASARWGGGPGRRLVWGGTPVPAR